MIKNVRIRLGYLRRFPQANKLSTLTNNMINQSLYNDINGHLARKREDRYHFGGILGIIAGIVVAILIANLL